MFKQSSTEQMNYPMSNKARVGLTAALIFVLIWSLSFRDARRARAQTTQAGQDEAVIIQSPTRRNAALTRGRTPETPSHPQVALATFSVTNADDANAGSLRQAIQNANDSTGPDNIVFSAFFDTPQTITLTTGELAINETVTITGPGANLLTVSGNNVSRIFRVDSGVTGVAISGMTISGGNVVGDGGGILTNGNLEINNCVVTGNFASGFSGGIENGGTLTITDSTISNNTNSTVQGGGGMSNTFGTMTITNSTISGNIANAPSAAGGLYVFGGTVTITNSTITNNAANAGNSGGGIGNDSGGNVIVSNSIIAGNQNNATVPDIAIPFGSGTFSSSGHNLIGNVGTVTAFNQTGDQAGGGPNAIINPLLGPLSLGGGTTPTHALLGGSPALDKGNSTGTDQRGLARQVDITTIAPATGGNNSDIGAVEMQARIVTNASDDGSAGSLRQTILNAPANSDILFDQTFFNIARTITLGGTELVIGKNLTIQGPGANLLTVSGNSESRVLNISNGFTVSLSGMSITGGDSAAGGGGIRNFGKLTVSNCHVTGNIGLFGGGLYNEGDTTLLQSTVSSNTGRGSDAGGGIDGGGTLTVTNSTISGNNAPNGSNNSAGGIWIGGATTITSSTITNNSAAGTHSAGGVFRFNGTVTIRNSIIAGNVNNATLPDVLAEGNIGLASSGHNLIGNVGTVTTFTATGDQPGGGANPIINPLLGPLSLNGGETPTHALLAGSPALDKGNSSGSTCDQRGLARPFDIATIAPPTANDDNADIGAVEMQALIVTTAADPGDGVCDNTCTLRDAITAANANGVGFDDILFSSTVGPTINLLTALPEITSSLSINGPGANLLTVRRNPGAPDFRIFTIPPSNEGSGQSVAITGMTISNGRATASGPTTFGGGIRSLRNLTLTNVTVSGNQATAGGGVALFVGNGTFTNSTFSGNEAGIQGGGITFQGSGAKLRLVNSTVSSNNAIGNGLGGGIANVSGGSASTLEMVNSTIANNTGTNVGGIYEFANPGATATTTLRNSIIANNTPVNLAIAESGTEIITSQGFNLSDNWNGFATLSTDQTATPLLDALASNGGPTLTHALLAGSPALDAGNNSGSGVATDQRGPGFARTVDLPTQNQTGGDGADIGAFESQTAPAPATLLQFSAAGYAASEITPTVQITVTRHGPTAGSSSVDYATSDRTATQVKDFTVAVGRLNFAPGETSKSFEIIITDDRFDDDSETFSVTLSNPIGALLVGTLSATQVTIADNDSGDGSSPVKGASFDADFFVRQHYADFLNRSPDGGGLAFWVGQTTGCGNADLLVCRINVSAAFFLSIEFQETGYYAIRARRVAFAKKSDVAATRVTFPQFIRDARQIGEGFVHLQPGAAAVLEANKQAFASQIVTSAEFVTNFPTSQTAEQYVAALYAKAGVTPTATETQQAVDAFNGAGGSTAGRIAAFRKVTDSTSVRDAEFRGAFVLLQYFGYMRRNPDQPGYAFWLGKLNQFNGNFITAEMVKAFITSVEYEERFGL